MPKPKTTASKGYTPKVNAATGFKTGVTTVKKANAASAKVKEYAPRGISPKGSLARAPKATPKPKSLVDKAADFVQSRVDLATGKTKTPISEAMKVRRTGPVTWKKGK